MRILLLLTAALAVLPGCGVTIAQTVQLKPGAIFKDCADCPEMVVVPQGSLKMGYDGGVSEDRYEGPVHDVTIGYAFALGRFEVTNEQFAEFVTATGHKAGTDCRIFINKTVEGRLGRDWRKPGYDYPPKTDQPAACVDWRDAKAYVAWLSDKTGQPYRLPTEAEWEYAARVNTASRYPWGDDPSGACPEANLYDQTAAGLRPWDPVKCSDGHRQAAPVGSLKVNSFGLYDMVGNVWEWAEDCYVMPYGVQPTDGSAHQVDGPCEKRVTRGGAWHSRATWQKPTFRGRDPEDFVTQVFGIRAARNLE